MRNLKRALSLALASVMLLGMMVVGSSAAFSDADEIVNKEAVEITAGLGLFAGSDGKFDPKGTVTRAQMAAVIAKMFYGSDLNADTYKGGNKFNDTAAFEGGWAEGYINLGVEKGWFKGYGDGSFRPGQAVTTAEAVTMLLNLLKVDAGAGTWPMTVMAAAEDIELFDLEVELKPAPATNVAMTRDELAVVVWNALNYSADGVQGYKVIGSNIVFKTWSDAAAFADVSYPDGADADSNPDWDASYISEVKNDTLAETVFEIKTATGYVTGNQATGEDYTIAAGLNINLETGLDMLGHFVTVYYAETYKSEKDPGVAYALVEEAEYVEVAETIGTYNAGVWTGDKKDYLAAFGTKVEVTSLSVKDFDGANAYVGPVDYSETDFYAEAGTYVVSLETGKIIAFIAPVSASVDKVNRITTTAGKESIKLGTTLLKNSEDDDQVVEYDGIAEDDIVIVKNYLGVTYLEKPEVVSGKITKTGTVDSKPATYIDGKAYENGIFAGANAAGLTTVYGPDANKTFDAYLYNGKLVGVVQTSSAADLSEVVYVVDAYDVAEAGTYGATVTKYYVQGINAAGEEVTVLIGIAGCVDTDPNTTEVVVSHTDFENNYGVNKFYTFEKSNDKEQAKKDIQVAVAAKNAGNFNNKVDEFFADEALVAAPGELKKTDKYLTFPNAGKVYLTAETKFIVVEDNQGQIDELEVATYTGSIAKSLAANDKIAVAITEDENENNLASIVVIYTRSLSLKAEDYIFVVDGNDYSVVEGGYEYEVYFSATNEFKAIVTDIRYGAGFYGDYEIDEDGIYDLKTADNGTGDYVKLGQEVNGIFGTSIDSAAIDTKDAADAKVVDVRDAEWVEDKSEVATIESLKDIASALKAGYKVFFNALLEDDGADKVVTHIFVTSVKAEDTDAQGNGLGTYSEA